MNEHTPDNSAERKPVINVRVAIRVSALVVALLLVAIGLLPVLPFAIYFATLRCDETCAPNTDWNTGWQGDPGAWQWDVQLLIALGAVVAALLAVRWAWRGNWRGCLQALAVAILGYGGWVALLAS